MLSTPQHPSSRPTLSVPTEALAGDDADSPDFAGPDTTSMLRWTANRRVLIVDDNPAIHGDSEKYCAVNKASKRRCRKPKPPCSAAQAKHLCRPRIRIEVAHQGQEALEKVQRALAADRPYALAFVDVRMPPGWDGIETVSRIWQVYPEFRWSFARLIRIIPGTNDRQAGFFQQPGDSQKALRQRRSAELAHAFTRKWELNRRARLKLAELTRMVALRTGELEGANANLKREAEERLSSSASCGTPKKWRQWAASPPASPTISTISSPSSTDTRRSGPARNGQEPHARSLEEIRVSAERAAKLVRQLLTFSRKRAMHFRNVALDEVIGSVAGMLRQFWPASICTSIPEWAAGCPHPRRPRHDRTNRDEPDGQRAGRDFEGRPGVVCASAVTLAAGQTHANSDARPC